MNKTFGLLAALGLGLALTGCGNTLSGAKQDAAQDTQTARDAAATAAQKTQAAADKAGAAVKAVPQNMDANAVVRPEVKTALIRDPVLNDKRNVIDVNGKDHTITLNGHVADASMKQRATEDAQVVLTKRHPDFTVDNQLLVGAGAQ